MASAAYEKPKTGFASAQLARHLFQPGFLDRLQRQACLQLRAMLSPAPYVRFLAAHVQVSLLLMAYRRVQIVGSNLALRIQLEVPVFCRKSIAHNLLSVIYAATSITVTDILFVID